MIRVVKRHASDWELPEELLEPVQHTASNLAIMMLSCPTIGHDVLTLVGRFITEQSLLNIWFLEDVKGSGRGLEEVLSLTEFGDKQTRAVYEAWKSYKISVSDERLDGKRERIIDCSEALVGALESAIAALMDIRGATQ